jgi:hypothetical protein
MRRRARWGETWLRAAALVGCIPIASGGAQERFIQQPKSSARETRAESDRLPMFPNHVAQVPHQAVATDIVGVSSKWSQDVAERATWADVSQAESMSPTAMSSTASGNRYSSPQRTATGYISQPQPISQPQDQSLSSSRSTLPESDVLQGASQPSKAGLNFPKAQNLQWRSVPNTQANSMLLEKSPPPQSNDSFKDVPHLPTVQVNALQVPHGLTEGSQASQQRVDSIESRILKLESTLIGSREEQIRKPAHGRLVSSRTSEHVSHGGESEVQMLISPVENPHGWQAIGQQLGDRMTKCEGLLSRGAQLSARQEAEMGVVILLRHLDVISNMYRCEPTWIAANTSLREADDFVSAQHLSADTGSLKRLIEAHETPLLKGASLDGVSPQIAAQHYRLLAEKLLAEAAQGHPWASELYYAIGRTYQVEAEQNKEHVDTLRARALCYYRASRATQPTNAVACNQLGYLLLQMDRAEDAREAIVAALSHRVDDAFLSNLAEASRRLGDNPTRQWALQTMASRNSGRPPHQNVPQIVELSPTEFAQLSPYASSPNLGGQGSAPEAGRPSTPRTATAPMPSILR